MLKTCLRRFGLWPVVGAVTLVAIAASVAITAAVHAVVFGTPMDAAAWLLSVLCPLIVAPTMSAGTFSLLQQLDRAHDRLRVLSDTDELTGAYNRRYFMERVREEAERSARNGHAFTIALIDVDNFKAVNDRHGHLAGDEVLRELARVCIGNMRGVDTFARFGGEEFAVLLPQTGIEQARPWLERLRQRVAQLRIDVPGSSVGITISVGLGGPGAAPLLPLAQVNAVLRMADEALYRAKHDGKNRVAAPA